MYFNGKKIGNNLDRVTLEKNVENILKQQSGIVRHTISTIGLDFPMPAGYREILLEIHVPMSMQLDKKTYQDFLDKFDAEFVYKSMYGQRFLYHTYSREALKFWRLKTRLFLKKLGFIF